VGGDRSAFARLAEHYQSACYGLAWRLLGDADRAADATQDALFHAYGAIAGYRGGTFRSWLLRITANASYDILRRAQRRPTTELPSPDEGAPELPDLAAVNPLREAARSEMYRHLERALQELPDDQRIAVVLCDVYGMDYGQVARLTESALGTVKSRIHRGRLRLRELLADHRELFSD
jgi:RNA polymerase sigma-70 factor (ECF subfamily)